LEFSERVFVVARKTCGLMSRHKDENAFLYHNLHQINYDVWRKSKLEKYAKREAM